MLFGISDRAFTREFRGLSSGLPAGPPRLCASHPTIQSWLMPEKSASRSASASASSRGSHGRRTRGKMVCSIGDTRLCRLVGLRGEPVPAGDGSRRGQRAVLFRAFGVRAQTHGHTGAGQALRCRQCLLDSLVSDHGCLGNPGCTGEGHRRSVARAFSLSCHPLRMHAREAWLCPASSCGGMHNGHSQLYCDRNRRGTSFDAVPSGSA